MKILCKIKKCLFGLLTFTALATPGFGDVLRDERGTFPGIFPITFFKTTAASSSYIQSIQRVTITIASTALSNTASISSVNTSNSIILFGGSTNNDSFGISSNDFCRVELTNGTTVTAFRGVNTANLITNVVHATVIEFASDVNSIQRGTITITAGTSNTATISAVGANAAVIWLGGVCNAVVQDAFASLTLTNSTTVTANSATSVTGTVGYVVFDLTSNIFASTQARSVTPANTDTSKTDTITSVNTNNAIILMNGFGGVATNVAQNLWRFALTNSTTVTLTRGAAPGSGTPAAIKYTVYEFASGALNGSIQRGTITLSNVQTSNTASISSIDTAKSFVNYCGLSTTETAAYNKALCTTILTNGTTVTTTIGASGTGIVSSYEAVQFV